MSEVINADDAIEKALLLWADNNYQEAYSLLNRVLSRYPKNIRALGVKGNLLDDQALNQSDVADDNFEKARECYEKILELEPERLQALIDLADYWGRRKTYDKALSLYDKAIDLIKKTNQKEAQEGLQEDLGDILQQKFLLLEECGDHKMLMQVVSNALEVFPESDFFKARYKKFSCVGRVP